MRALRGAPGSKVSLTIIRGNAADPHVVELTREDDAGADVTGTHRRRRASATSASRRSARRPPAQVKTQIADLPEGRRDEADRRRAARVERHARRRARRSRACSSPRARSRIARDARAARRETIAAARRRRRDHRCRRRVLVDTGTSGAAELFASALAGNKRADLIGEHTIGRAAVAEAGRLPDGSGLWLSTTRYLTPSGDAAARERASSRPSRSTSRTSNSASRRRPTDPDPRQGARAAHREESRVRIGNRVIGSESDLPITQSIPNYQITNTDSAILTVRLTPVFSRCRRVAQRLERLLDTQEVGGSSPPVPTNLRSPDRQRELRLASHAKAAAPSGRAAKAADRHDSMSQVTVTLPDGSSRTVPAGHACTRRGGRDLSAPRQGGARRRRRRQAGRSGAIRSTHDAVGPHRHRPAAPRRCRSTATARRTCWRRR